MAFSSFPRPRQPAVRLPEDEEEEDLPPMLHSGSVRAFSHLPEPELREDMPPPEASHAGPWHPLPPGEVPFVKPLYVVRRDGPEGRDLAKGRPPWSSAEEAPSERQLPPAHAPYPVPPHQRESSGLPGKPRKPSLWNEALQPAPLVREWRGDDEARRSPLFRGDLEDPQPRTLEYRVRPGETTLDHLTPALLADPAQSPVRRPTAQAVPGQRSGQSGGLFEGGLSPEDLHDYLQEHGHEPEVRPGGSARSPQRSSPIGGSLFHGPISEQDLHEFLQEHGDKPEVRDLLQRHGDESEVQDLLYRSHSRNFDIADPVRNADNHEVQPVALAALGGRSGSPPIPKAAPQARVEGQLPAPQNYADAPKNAAKQAASQAVKALPEYRSQQAAAQQALERLQKAQRPSADAIKKAEKNLAVISRTKESVELAAQLINSKRNPEDEILDPDSIEENSPEYRSEVLKALSGLHGGTAPWMDRLAENFGENEMKGKVANPNIKKFINNVDPANVPWCGYAMAAAMSRSKLNPPENAGASASWKTWGETADPKKLHVGDVYYINYQHGKGHVSTVVGVSKDGNQVFCLGGNQNDGLNISAYPAKKFGESEVHFRRPPGHPNNIPAPVFDYNADISNFGILSGLTR